MKNLIFLILLLYGFSLFGQSAMYRTLMKNPEPTTGACAFYLTEGVNFVALPDTLPGTNDILANTGCAYDKQRGLIYVAATRLGGTPSPRPRVFDETGVLVDSLPFFALQGLAYDYTDSTFYTVDLTRKVVHYTYAGVRLDSFDYTSYPDESAAPTKVEIDPINRRILGSMDGSQRGVQVYEDVGGTWTLDTIFAVGYSEEGVTYDETHNLYWCNGLTTTRAYSAVDYSFVIEIAQPPDAANVNEGLAYNPNNNSLYWSSDKHIHGGVVNGNRVVELILNCFNYPP
jgi:hypothetical protein